MYRLIAKVVCLLGMLSGPTFALAADIEFLDNGIDPATQGAQAALDLMRYLERRGNGSIVLRHAPSISDAEASRRRSAYRAFLMFQGIQSRDFGPMPMAAAADVSNVNVLTVRGRITLAVCADKRRLHVEFDTIRDGLPAEVRLLGSAESQSLIMVSIGDAIGAFDAATGLGLENLDHGRLTVRLIDRSAVPANLRGNWLYGSDAEALRQAGALGIADIALNSKQLGTPERPSSIRFPSPPPPTSGQSRAEISTYCMAALDLPL